MRNSDRKCYGDVVVFDRVTLFGFCLGSVMKNILFLSFTLVFTVMAQAQIQAEPGRTLKNPSDVLQNNQCVFRQKNIAALQGYDLIVDACDRRYTNSLVLVSDRLKQGMCAYDLLQNMTGYTLARVVKPCPTRNVNPLVENVYAEEPPLEEAKGEAKPGEYIIAPDELDF